MTALCIICCLNEADFIPWTVRHLKRQGCDVLVVDCQSTDDSRRLAIREGARIEAYDAPPVSWHALLGRVEQIAERFIGVYDWCVHCDADELRYTDILTRDAIEVFGNPFDNSRHFRPGPWQHPETLIGGFQRVQDLGYNAIDHHVLTFHPTADSAGFDGSQDPEQYFRHYSGDPLNQRIGQVKAWRNAQPVSLAHSGGHHAQFIGRRIYPGKFISKHYPIRSQAHGERKVFQERHWLDPLQGRSDWHVQYRGIEPGQSFLKDPEELTEWK